LRLCVRAPRTTIWAREPPCVVSGMDLNSPW
jgi:hypothetical protein